jgi:hypothetical protein
MDESAHLQRIEECASELDRVERLRDAAIVSARADKVHAREIASAARLNRSTLWRLLDRERTYGKNETDPARHRDYAPALVVEQPRTGLTIGIGTVETVPPVATFTFDESHPVLLLLEAGWTRDRIPDVWPVIAAGVTASDARVQIYGPLPRREWDSPSYFGEWDRENLDRLCYKFDRRIRQIDHGQDLAPILVCLDVSLRSLENRVIDTALAFGHHARMYVIARTRIWESYMALVSSVLSVGVSRTGLMLPDKLPGVPRLPSQPDTAILATPESVVEFVLPPNPQYSERG